MIDYVLPEYFEDIRYKRQLMNLTSHFELIKTMRQATVSLILIYYLLWHISLMSLWIFFLDETII